MSCRSLATAFLAIAVAVCALGALGCVHVPPYQRGRLAHPTMLLGEMAGPGEAHVYAIHEGAVGGGSAVEGGCGCN
jgi:hypothetical protein